MAVAQCAGCQHGISQHFLAGAKGGTDILGRAGLVTHKELMQLVTFANTTVGGIDGIFYH